MLQPPTSPTLQPEALRSSRSSLAGQEGEVFPVLSSPLAEGAAVDQRLSERELVDKA